jgi:thioredoxin 1
VVQTLTEENIQSQINEGVVAVDCFTSWCGPCKMMEPIIEDTASSTQKARFYKINVEDTPNFSGTYGITTVPTVLFFKEGQLVKTISGVKPKEEFIKVIDEIS